MRAKKTGIFAGVQDTKRTALARTLVGAVIKRFFEARQLTTTMVAFFRAELDKVGPNNCAENPRAHRCLWVQ